MKILHLISGGDTGGAKTHVLSLIKELGKHADAKIICFIEDEFYYDGKKMGIDIEVLKQRKRADLSIIKRLRDIIISEDFDIIHSHGARANFISMLLKMRVKKPFITTIHSDYKLDFKDNVYKRFVYTTINEIALKCFDYYIAVSSNFREMLVSRGFKSNKIFTVYNGIDLNQEIDVTPKSVFLEGYKIDHDDKLIVGIAGRLDLVKNHEVFIKAANEVLSKRDDVIFLIAGSGAEEKRLYSMTKEFNINDKVFFLGFVKQPYSFFNVLDINVLTSVSESFPYVILEGARMKKVIVSTNVGGLSDLVSNDFNGYLFDVGDFKQLAAYLNTLLDDKQKIKDMGENLYKTVNKKFSLEKMGLDHYEIYKKVTSDRR
ncbi:glycosyltransferase family 4 protein [Brassicibacter mesophilus]|uniref:glycosyltransferase family 4 protein n=1 Tax=Brassicibacter mesophilus TaxID=745119 RepID=UPI003D1C84CE